MRYLMLFVLMALSLQLSSQPAEAYTHYPFTAGFTYTGGHWTTFWSYYDDEIDPGDDFFAHQAAPTRTCRYRTFYRHPTLPDWHTVGVTMDPTFDGFAYYTGGPNYGTYQSGVTRYDLQVYCSNMLNGSGYSWQRVD